FRPGGAGCRRIAGSRRDCHHHRPNRSSPRRRRDLSRQRRPMKRKRTAILISGRGSNMTALVEAAADPDYPAEIAGVISDQPNAAGLGIAVARNLPVQVVRREDFGSREAHDEAIDDALSGQGAEDRKSTRLNSSHVKSSYA